MNLIGSRIIETKRLILRPTKEEDLRVLYDILSIPEVNRYYLTCKICSTFEDEYEYQMKKLERAYNKDIFQWSIVKKDNNECIGQICVQKIDDISLDVRDIGWFINPKEQRRGYAFESASKIIDYMFNEVEIKAIKTSCAVCNPASYLLMEKLGFIRQGNLTHKQKYTFIDEEINCYSYNLIVEKYNIKQ